MERYRKGQRITESNPIPLLRRSGKGQAAEDWLLQLLQREGAQPSWRIYELAEQAGHSKSAIGHARTRLNLTFARESRTRMGLMWGLEGQLDDFEPRD